MEWETILGVAATLVTLGATAVAIAKYFSTQSRKMSLLGQEIKELTNRTKVLSSTLATAPSGASTEIYEQLRAASTDACNAVDAAFHSISVPVPLTDAKDLRIILSTDPEAEKVLGREFPINKGLAGWVFQRQQPSFKNPGQVDERHFELVDKAAGTATGLGALLTMPLIHGGVCRGVIQFMKPAVGRFSETDVAVATRFTPRIARLLGELENSKEADIPSVARGSEATTTIVFTDIVGFSAIANQLRLDDAVAMLNEYYTRLVERALRHQATVLDYVGDGIYLSFQQQSPTRAAHLAVSAALDMKEEYAAILEGWKNYQHPVSDQNIHVIGIATGGVHSGRVGHEKARLEKLIGPPVNNAAHLCMAAKTSRHPILICRNTRELLDSPAFQIEQTSADRIGLCYSVGKTLRE
jgi:class 3 adenylate cyclase